MTRKMYLGHRWRKTGFSRLISFKIKIQSNTMSKGSIKYNIISTINYDWNIFSSNFLQLEANFCNLTQGLNYRIE
jgi:hypothetical protein